jgi:hypothetical protein
MMSEQGTKLKELMVDFLDTLSILKGTTTIATLVLENPSCSINKEEIIANLAAVVIPRIENNYFDTLRKESYISESPMIRSWELNRLIAERCNQLVTQIVDHVHIQAESSVKKDWENTKSALKEIVPAIVCTLTSYEACLRMYFEYTKEFSQVYRSTELSTAQNELSTAQNDYMAYAQSTEALAAKMFVQARNVCKQTKADLEIRERLLMISQSSSSVLKNKDS